MSQSDICPHCHGSWPEVQNGVCLNCTTFIDQASKEFNMEPPLCEHTLRKAIAEIRKIDGFPAGDPGRGGYLAAKVDSLAALETLLPTKNRATELVEAWKAYCAPTYRNPDDAEAMANWLISNNLINEKGAL